MASDVFTTSKKTKSVTLDEASQKVKQRLNVGQVVQGVVEDTKPYGAFFDIGESSPGFLDVIEVPSEPFEIGRQISLKIVQFADWNRQIRVTPADDHPHIGPNPLE